MIDFDWLDTLKVIWIFIQNIFCIPVCVVNFIFFFEIGSLDKVNYYYFFVIYYISSNKSGKIVVDCNIQIPYTVVFAYKKKWAKSPKKKKNKVKKVWKTTGCFLWIYHWFMLQKCVLFLTGIIKYVIATYSRHIAHQFGLFVCFQ